MFDAGQHSQSFRQQRQQNRGEDDADGVAHATEDDHDDEGDGLQETKAAGRDELFRVRVKSAGDAREKCADDERGDFVFGGVDAHRLGGNFVVAHGDEAASVSGIDERGDDINRHRREAERPKQICPAVHDAQAARRADGVHVLQDDADDFAEAERDDGEIIAAQPQRGNADEQPGNRRSESAREQRDKKNSVRGENIPFAEMVGNDCRRVSADSHETRVAQGKLPGVAVDEIQADGHHDADADVVKNVEPVGIYFIRDERRQKDQRQRAEQKSFGMAEVHTFSISFLPSRPDGFTSRIKIKTAKAMASR